MYYIIKIANSDELKFLSGKYLYSGDSYFIYTDDIYKARNFKTIKAAQRVVDLINESDSRRKPIIKGIELKEVDI